MSGLGDSAYLSVGEQLMLVVSKSLWTRTLLRCFEPNLALWFPYKKQLSTSPQLGINTCEATRFWDIAGIISATQQCLAEIQARHKFQRIWWNCCGKLRWFVNTACSVSLCGRLQSFRLYEFRNRHPCWRIIWSSADTSVVTCCYVGCMTDET